MRHWYAIPAVVFAITAFLPVRSSSGDKSEASVLNILYPQHNSVVGRMVNVVVDPASDWSAIPFFQVAVGSTEHPVVDTSSGRHAVQGVALGPGLNTITVRGLAPVPTKDGKDKGADNQKYAVIVSRTITVYNRDGAFGVIPDTFAPHLFHSRQNEEICSGCHRLEAEQQDFKAAKPQDVLCYTCHQQIPKGRYMHGPAALWNCLECHDPEIYPVKYQFTAVDPWKVAKTTQPVEPAVFTIPADRLFKPFTAVLLSDDVPPVPVQKGRKRDLKKEQELKKKRSDEIQKRKDEQRKLFAPLLEYAKLNPSDAVRIEAHVDTTPPPKQNGKKPVGFKTHKQLTDARAKVLAKLLKEYGIAGKNRIVSVGMGSALPKAPNTTKENRELNNRIEIVVHPPDVKIQNSQKLPVLKDRERVIVNIAYAKSGAEVRSLSVVERLPRGLQYQKGSGVFRGSTKEPSVKGDALTWHIGDLGAEFQETLSYIIKKEKGSEANVSQVIRLGFNTGRKDEVRDFDPEKPSKQGRTVKETCEKCHGSMMAGAFRHGPADAGYCTLCHDPHASNYPAWTRRQSWRLCTTCHAEKKTEAHIIRGFVYDTTHPTQKWKDPARPGKRLACVSCHAPHSAETPELLAYNVRDKFEICSVCHVKK